MTNVKVKDEHNDSYGTVYKIKFSDYQDSYIGETDRNLNIRLTERKRATRYGDVNNHIFKKCFFIKELKSPADLHSDSIPGKHFT